MHKRGFVLLALIALVLAGCGVQSVGTTLPAATPTTAPVAEAAGTQLPAITAPTAATVAPAPTTAPAETAVLPATEPATAAAPAATASPAATEVPATVATDAVTAVTTDATSALRLVLDPAASEARYRVKEQLAGRSLPNDAVGATKDITGTVVIATDGTIDGTASRFVVDLRNLKSDQSRRDGYLQRNTLETATYPTVVFVPRSVEGLPSPLPTSGNVTFKVTGDLTLRDVTQSVTWDVQGQITGQELTGSANTAFTFADFGMTQPRVAVVLSIEDNIKLEVDFRMVAENGG